MHAKEYAQYGRQVRIFRWIQRSLIALCVLFWIAGAVGVVLAVTKG